MSHFQVESLLSRSRIRIATAQLIENDILTDRIATYLKYENCLNQRQW